MHTFLEDADIVSDSGTTDAGVHLDIHEVTEGSDHLVDLKSKLSGGGQDDGLASSQLNIQSLQNADGEGGGLASSCQRNKKRDGEELSEKYQYTKVGVSKLTRLGLGNDIAAEEDGFDGSLLDGRGFFETVGEDASEEIFFQVHTVESGGHLIPVGRDLSLLWGCG